MRPGPPRSRGRALRWGFGAMTAHLPGGVHDRPLVAGRSRRSSSGSDGGDGGPLRGRLGPRLGSSSRTLGASGPNDAGASGSETVPGGPGRAVACAGVGFASGRSPWAGRPSGAGCPQRPGTTEAVRIRGRPAARPRRANPLPPPAGIWYRSRGLGGVASSGPEGGRSVGRGRRDEPGTAFGVRSALALAAAAGARRPDAPGERERERVRWQDGADRPGAGRWSAGAAVGDVLPAGRDRGGLAGPVRPE